MVEAVMLWAAIVLGFVNMTLELFRTDAYLQECSAQVTKVVGHAICLDRTVFYPMGGGQPGDTGVLIHADGNEVAITDTRKERETGDHLHVLGPDAPIMTVGENIDLRIDWERRYRLMRMHSCMHVLCAVIDAPVTGGSIRDGSARLDFDLPEPPDKEAVESRLNKLIQEDHPMELQWITDEELERNPELVRTMSVQPPKGSGRVRLVNFKGVDLQPCGGTHVSSSAEIGKVRIRKIEKKGKLNRRVIIEFA
jgi:misacylated tRNA(Ala) deacylase